MAKILVVDNEERMCKIIQSGLELEQHRVDIALSGQDALLCLHSGQSYDLVITDLKMQQVDGLEVLEEAKKLDPAPEVILITAYASQQTALEAIRLGAYDYLIKPFEISELSLRINRILHQKQLEEENQRLRAQVTAPSVPNLIGKSIKMREIHNLINRVAETDATVLIRGESGTGKELVAEAIHKQSNRAKFRFVVVNCAAVPENLLESELFGYEKGAFTGATQRKLGLFELAHKGTLFLDEIGDISLGIQAKLLRVLQNKEIIRVGGTEKIMVDARVIVATNRHLESMIQTGLFRSDLFYRINIFPIFMPALCEHKEDIPELIQHYTARMGRKAVTAAARNILMKYDWPGNVRELINVLERAAIVADTMMDVQHLPEELSKQIKSADLYSLPDQGIRIDELEKNLILTALEKAGGNKTRAAELLGITRRRLYSMIERFGIRPE